MALQWMGTVKNTVGKLMQGSGPFGPGDSMEGTVATMPHGELRGYRPAAPGSTSSQKKMSQTAQQQASQMTGYSQTGQMPMMGMSGQMTAAQADPYAGQQQHAGFGGMLDKLLGGRRAKRAQQQAAAQYSGSQPVYGEGAYNPQGWSYSQSVYPPQQPYGYTVPQADPYGAQYQYSAQQPMQQADAMQYSAQQQPVQTGYSAQQAFQYSAQQPVQPDAYAAPQGWAYGTSQQPNAYTAQQPGYAYGMNAQGGFQQAQPQAQPVYGGNENATAQFGSNAPYTPDPQPRGRRGARGKNRDQADNGNVVYMNQGDFVDANGTAYRMVLRMAQPRYTSSCYRIIEFMRNGEAVLVNTEQIKEDREVTRCLDLIYGASYALNCACTRAASRCLYVITPRDVNVLPYASLEDMNQRDAAQRWPGSDPSNPKDKTWDRPAARSAYSKREPEPVPGYRPADDFRQAGRM